MLVAHEVIKYLLLSVTERPLDEPQLWKKISSTKQFPAVIIIDF